MRSLYKAVSRSPATAIFISASSNKNSHAQAQLLIFPFKNAIEQERGKKGNMVKRHFQFIYDSPINSPDTLHIFLDVLFEHNHYDRVIKKEIANDLLLTEGENLVVTVPTIDCVLGDKLTAFAPHTTGIRFGEKKPSDLHLIGYFQRRHLTCF